METRSILWLVLGIVFIFSEQNRNEQVHSRFLTQQVLFLFSIQEYPSLAMNNLWYSWIQRHLFT